VGPRMASATCHSELPVRLATNEHHGMHEQGSSSICARRKLDA
jgi:hypothetical protein